MSVKPSDLLVRPTAADVTFGRGDPIWYRQIVTNAGTAVLWPGVFERYGSIRVAVVLVTPTGREERVYVSPLNVYARLDRDERADERVEEPSA